LFSNRLVLTDQTFVDSKKLEKVEVSHSFRGRNLRGAALNRADLRKADFTGTILDEAKLDFAKLENAQFGCVLTGESLSGPCTFLRGVSLTAAEAMDGQRLFAGRFCVTDSLCGLAPRHARRMTAAYQSRWRWSQWSW
jgi:uncharacterized protein YjbI with pentapeptide repeats